MLVCNSTARLLHNGLHHEPQKPYSKHLKQVSRRPCSAAATAADPLHLTTELRLLGAAMCIPHPDKVETGGEDAHFVSMAGGGALGIADGVGGWADSGVSPAEYSRKFMKTMCEVLEGKQDPTPTENSTVSGEQLSSQILQSALETAHSTTRLPGSCTACAIKLESGTGQVVGLNLGDSGFMIIRDGKVIVKSAPMQHFFDCPCQFGAYPEYVEATDVASDAEEYLIKGKPGDCIVMGSDGLWDNLPDEDILRVVNTHPSEIEKVSEKVAKLAYSNSLDDDFDSPYSIAARNEGYDLEWYEKLLYARIVDWRPECGKLTGGKMDDVTVVVGYIDALAVPSEATTLYESEGDS